MIEFAISMLGHLAEAVELLACSVKDILTLRWLLVLGGGFWLGYLGLQSHILWVPFLWGILFILVNLFRILLIYKDNRSISFNDEEKQLFLTVFQNFTAVEFARLIKQASWENFEKGKTVINEGEIVNEVMLIYTGSASVIVGGIEKAVLLPDQFLGEMSYLSGKPASASVVAKEDIRLVKWSQENLKIFMQRQPSLKSAFLSLLTTDLSVKLQQSDAR